MSINACENDERAIRKQSTPLKRVQSLRQESTPLSKDLKSVNEKALLEGPRKPVQKLDSLPADIPQKILKARLVPTKFGESILVELEESVVFLPRRVTDDFKTQLGYLNTQKYSIVFRGTEDFGKAHPAVRFEIVEN